MTSSSRMENLRKLYDDRAPTYDHEPSKLHREQAREYTNLYMSLTPGLHVLDLACGTGGIAIPTARSIAPSGTVLGVDISTVSLSIARAKAEREELNNIRFVEHDIANVDGVEGVSEGFFDYITCASAFVFVENPGEAVRHWAKLLKKGGKIIFDVPTPTTMVQGFILDKVASKLGITMPYSRAKLDSTERLKELLVDAGLDPADTFISSNYQDGGSDIDTNDEKAEMVWDALVKEKRWADQWYRGLLNGKTTGVAKEHFIKELKMMAGKDGTIKQETRFYIAVGTKI